ncbi:MAG: UDP-2,4-diacetamido-2,4,6-trideoxy-beta-L-altropyranose hydrolase [Opitutales bacterium]|nr:UDP-2,4-diacetamido-2,4,6-trideoxy-beta-L-altropyranose hydrolase [Opitutales bacterium]
MKLLIRADASAEIGHGHILRMLALAQAWRKRGGHAIFCSVECPENLSQRVRKEGFEVCQLECELIGGGQDLELTKALANDLKADWVVLDGYSFDFDYQRQIRNSFVKLLVVDDFRFEQSFDADVLLNCSPIVTEEDYRCCKSKSTMLLGIDYCLLREEFWSIKKDENPNGDSSLNVLVVFGGTDPYGLTTTVFRFLNKLAFPELHFRVLTLRTNTHYHTLTEEVARSSLKAEICTDVTVMVEQYEWADAVISATGGMTWEWMRFGLQAATVPVAENQMSLSNYLHENGFSQVFGRRNGSNIEIDFQVLERWISGLSSSKINRSLPEVDGQGALRVVDFMLGL